MVSMYKPKQTGPAVDARTFSTDCFNEDLTMFRTQVRDNSSCSLMFLGRLAPVMAVAGQRKHAMVRGRQASRAYVLAEARRSF